MARRLRATAANRFDCTPSAKGMRRLRSVALGFLAATGGEDAPGMAFAQFTARTT